MYSEKDLLFSIPEQSILIKASGGFARRVFVATLSEDSEPGTIDFLEKILTAAGLKLEKDTLFVQLSETETSSILPVLKDKQAESVLVFGISPKQLGIQAQIPLYQNTPFYGANFLWADKLSALQSDKALKAKLWQALQLMFLK